MAQRAHDAAVIGGGTLGASLALSLRRQLSRVVLVDREPDLLRRASYANQARVHNGYHYPRSLLTGLRSRVNFPRFVEDYRECVDADVTHVYAIGRLFSKVNAAQFRTFCARIGAPVEPAPREVRALFSPDLVEDVFLVQEAVFDAVKLRLRLRGDLERAGVELRLGMEVERVTPAPDHLEIHARTSVGCERLRARRVFSCTYARLNHLLSASGLPLIPLKHELTEMPLVRVPAVLQRTALTIMDGPFFSLMPFPSEGLHTLHHVRYTPHLSWREDDASGCRDPETQLRDAPRATRFAHMRRDVQRYVPSLRDLAHVDSIWEVKTVLPSSEVDDSRPILFRRDHGLAGFFCIMGGKIDNVYDVLEELEHSSPREDPS